MKRNFISCRLWMACMMMGTTLTFSACSNDDEPTPTEPKMEDVYGDYTGELTFDPGVNPTEGEEGEEETNGIAIDATVRNDTVYFNDFPVRDVIASVVGEESADQIVEAIGTVSYKVGYKASMTAAKDSVYMEMSPKALELALPVDEKNTMTISVEISAANKGDYEFETQNLNMELKAEKVLVDEQEFPTFPATGFIFEMKKK